MSKYKTIVVRLLLWFSFLLFLWVLFFILFMVTGREDESVSSIWEYASKNVRLRPFETIGAYIKAMKYGYMTPAEPLTNLIGNFLLLMPFGVYLPLFFTGLKRRRNYIMAVLLIIFGVEVAQLVLMRGVLDIDDVILNFSGAMIGLLLWKFTWVKKLEDVYRGKLNTENCM